MKCSILLLAAVAVVQASPVPAPVPVPQGVTSQIAPSMSAPPGCMPSWSGTFGIVVMNVTAGGAQAVSQKSDVS